MKVIVSHIENRSEIRQENLLRQFFLGWYIVWIFRGRKMTQERYMEFDIAKGIAAYLVVLGHLLDQIAGRDITLLVFCHIF